MNARWLILGYLFLATTATPLLLESGHPVVLMGMWLFGNILFIVPAVIPNNQIFGPVTTSFPTSRREVWLTIDDGPHPEDTPRILEVLAQHQVRATFFLIGQRAALYPELVREIHRQGHTLGNHTLTHPKASFWMAQPSRLHHEISQCSRILSSISPQAAISGFRAPAGMVNLFLHPVLQRQPCRLIGWSARGFDSIWIDPQKIVDRIWEGVSPGAIILLHEGNRPLGKPPVNPRSLDLLLHRLKADGYAVVIPESFLG